MADTTTKSVLKLVATTSSKIRDLTIQDGNLIFIQDLGRIALDFKGKRVFYNQIVELDTEADRKSLGNPLSGYYFVISSARLWFYKDEWIAITEEPQEIVFVGVELPELGQANKIYANIMDREISVWNEDTGEYITVANYCGSISVEEVIDFFD